MQKHHHLLYRVFGTYRSSPCTLSHHRYWHPVFRPIGKHKNTFIYSITPSEHRIYHLPIYRAIGTLKTSPTCSLSHHHNTHIQSPSRAIRIPPPPPPPAKKKKKNIYTIALYMYIHHQPIRTHWKTTFSFPLSRRRKYMKEPSPEHTEKTTFSFALSLRRKYMKAPSPLLSRHRDTKYIVNPTLPCHRNTRNIGIHSVAPSEHTQTLSGHQNIEYIVFHHIAPSEHTLNPSSTSLSRHQDTKCILIDSIALLENHKHWKPPFRALKTQQIHRHSLYRAIRYQYIVEHCIAPSEHQIH